MHEPITNAHPEDVRKLFDIHRNYQNGTLAELGSTRNNLITIMK